MGGGALGSGDPMIGRSERQRPFNSTTKETYLFLSHETIGCPTLRGFCEGWDSHAVSRLLSRKRQSAAALPKMLLEQLL